MPLTNQTIKNYDFLKGMYKDPYFPDKVVDKGKQILLDLCLAIEAQKPQSLEALYKLSHAATDKFNALQNDFWDNDRCISLRFASLHYVPYKG